MIRKGIWLAHYFSSFNASKDYYKVLNVKANANTEQIKKSFRTLAKQYHPDANKGNQEKFKQLNEAYQVLSSSSTKRDYDDARRSQSQSSDTGGYSGFQGRPNYRQQYSHQHYNTYRGYQKQTGWHDPNFREEAMQDMFRRQQKQFAKKNYNRSNAYKAEQEYNDTAWQRNNSSGYSPRTAKLQDQLNEMLKKNTEHIKITRQSVRRAYEEQRRKREQEFKNYKDQQKVDVEKQLKDRAWKMVEGVKNNVEGMVKAGKYVKQNMETVIKAGKLAKSLWDDYKNKKK